MQMRLSTFFISLFLLTGCHKKTQVVEKKPVPVEVVKAVAQDTQLYNSYVGHIQPTVQVNVMAQVEGVLTGYYFTEGQEVSAGDLIFTIDSRPYQAQLAKAEGALAQSIANLRYAEDVARRNAPLVEEDYVSRVQYDQYITDVMSYKAEIKQNEADIETAKINIGYCNIHAPMDAVTGKLQINVGNLITNAEQTPLVILNKITPAYAYFSVPQKDLPHIMKLHREKKLSTHVYLNQDKTPYKGTLDLIDNEFNDQTGSIWLRSIMPNKDKMLWPGEYVDVHLMLEMVQDAILVPTEAISMGQKGKYVFLIEDNETAKQVYIKTGQKVGSLTIIKEGVKAGDTVVTLGQINLSTGRKVTIKEKASEKPL